MGFGLLGFGLLVKLFIFLISLFSGFKSSTTRTRSTFQQTPSKTKTVNKTTTAEFRTSRGPTTWALHLKQPTISQDFYWETVN